ncbi:hypothetical protein P7C73_g5665, partial [Tremellales sp. Uapishka_1]
MLECWSYTGLVSRMILPLGLNVRSGALSLKSVMLPPAGDALEREERRVAVWMCLYHDTIASAASGWGTSLSLEELSIPLPVAVADFEAGLPDMPMNPQDLDSIDFWIKHPVADPFVMTLKAIVALNRVNRFVRKWKNRHIRDDDDLDGMQRVEFKEMANSIACLQMSFPASLRDPCKLVSKKRKILDVDLITAHLLPHCAIMCLYEPFADITDPNDPATRRLQNAAQGVVSIVQQIAGCVQDTSDQTKALMHNSASICLLCAARTILLFYRHALNINDQPAIQSYRTDVDMIRMAMAQFGMKFRIGAHHSQVLEYFLDRATFPTYEKMAPHYPDHPRTGAPELRRDSNFGLLVINALNIKRGYWRLSPPAPTQSADVSPMESTPETSTSTVSSSAVSSNHTSSAADAAASKWEGDTPSWFLKLMASR